MRRWTEASFDAARASLPDGADQDETVVWLRPRGTLYARRRPGEQARRLGRGAAILGIGVAASGFAPDAAVAPVTPARASVSIALPEPPPVFVEIEPAPAALDLVPASLSEALTTPPLVEDRRREVEEFLSFGSRSLPRSLVETIVEAADATAVDPIYLMALADKESSFRPAVKASTSSAEGLFQFIDRTWLETVRAYGGRHGLQAEADAIQIVDERPVVADEAVRQGILAKRRDPYLAAVMAAELLKRDAALIGFRIGRQLTPTEMYIAHFLGLEDATRFMEVKSARTPHNAVKAFPAAARANIAIFFESAKRRRRGLSVPEVFARLDRMIEPRIATFQSVRKLADARI